MRDSRIFKGDNSVTEFDINHNYLSNKIISIAFINNNLIVLQSL